MHVNCTCFELLNFNGAAFDNLVDLAQIHLPVVASLSGINSCIGFSQPESALGSAHLTGDTHGLLQSTDCGVQVVVLNVVLSVVVEDTTVVRRLTVLLLQYIPHAGFVA